jgi:hypothetical protein
MPSGAYTLIHRALRRREQLTFFYQGLPRECCPVILGYAADGREVLLACQFAGATSSRSKLRNGVASTSEASAISNRDGEPGWKAPATRKRRPAFISSMWTSTSRGR